MLTSGVPPWSGKMLLFGWEKGMPLMSVRAMIPVTILFDAWDPPRMSCMKKDNGGEVVVVVCGPAGFASVSLVATTGAGPSGGLVAMLMGPTGSGAATVTGGATGAASVIGGATGAASSTGAATVTGASVSSGRGGSA